MFLNGQYVGSGTIYWIDDILQQTAEPANMSTGLLLCVHLDADTRVLTIFHTAEVADYR